MASNETSFWPSGRTNQRGFVTMDGGVRVSHALAQRPDRYAYFHESDKCQPVIPRGAGFSFAAASFGSGVISIDFTAFDRILDLDTASGLVEVEAGITLGALFQYLAPHGYYLPIQPGHHGITIGGCIAADVHGKNPARDGTFIAQVECLHLFHPRHGRIEVSRKKEPALFHATCGGMGLTGIIVSARLRSKQLPSEILQLSHRPVATALEGALLLKKHSGLCDLTYAWYDFARGARSFGRGVAIIGNFAPESQKRGAFSLFPSRFSADSRAFLPVSLINPVSVRLLNAIYSLMLRPSSRQAGIVESLYPTRLNELYLSLFGRKGFREFQAIIPDDKFDEYVEFIRDQVSRFGICITLAVAKPFVGIPDLIRFTGNGTSLVVETPRTIKGIRFMEELDHLIIKLGGRPNIVKDSRLSRAVFEATYPECDQFRTILREWDPQRTFRSELSTRLGL